MRAFHQWAPGLLVLAIVPLLCVVQGVFFNWYPPKKLKYQLKKNTLYVLLSALEIVVCAIAICRHLDDCLANIIVNYRLTAHVCHKYHSINCITASSSVNLLIPLTILFFSSCYASSSWRIQHVGMLWTF